MTDFKIATDVETKPLTEVNSKTNFTKNDISRFKTDNILTMPEHLTNNSNNDYINSVHLNKSILNDSEKIIIDTDKNESTCNYTQLNIPNNNCNQENNIDSKLLKIKEEMSLEIDKNEINKSTDINSNENNNVSEINQNNTTNIPTNNIMMENNYSLVHTDKDQQNKLKIEEISRNKLTRKRLTDEEGYIRRAACICVNESESQVSDKLLMIIFFCI